MAAQHEPIIGDEPQTLPRVAITGNTYPVRAEIKALGGTWHAASKSWYVPAEVADRARELVTEATSRRRTGARGSRYGSTYTRFASGAEVYTNKRGRCEDAPCCGCCS